ncbi:hypothetical protein LCGC14_2003800 [marine sediment metagenome]|uniref:UDP-N-acetylglucosamine 2-epimerase domain-containing protein n=1 Tax=marine sediment metagenome TaxID=412755 RepID=A0A0F9F2G0_9ZZZZ
MSINKICIVTGSRSDYAYLKPIIEKIERSTKLEMFLVVTGIHLLEEHGNTFETIIKDGFHITKIIQMYDPKEKSKLRFGKSVGKAIINFTDCFNEIKPDIVLVLGDRYEPLAAVIAASTLSIGIAHIHGGDNVSKGQIDEQIRHAITKFAHIHFPATLKSSKRIILMGEEPWRVKMFGSPTMDEICEPEKLSKEELFKELQLNPTERTVLCVQHPYIVKSNKAGEQMAMTLQILKDLNIQSIIIYPNNDLGSSLIIKIIESYRNTPKFKLYKNLDRVLYLSLLKNANLLIGNSSSGLIETPFFKLPVINLGDRNKGRETGANVLHATFEASEFLSALRKGLSKEFKDFCQNVKNPYGEGKTGEKIVQILEELKIDKKLLIKRLTYKV